MAKKIITFLSANQGKEEETYRWPLEPGAENRSVKGKQTNEAPIRYYLEKYTGIESVICIVTPDAKEKTWEEFQHFMQAAAPNTNVIEIPFAKSEDFTQISLPKILDEIQDNDEILLETTGGFRDIIMYLLLLTRILSYKGIPTIQAIYSNYTEHCIEDVSHIIGLFDVVGGMQELTKFGSVDTLRNYYKKQTEKDARIDKFLKNMEELRQLLILCKTGKLEEKLEETNQALDAAEACEDPLIREMMPVYRKKFGKKMSIPSAIHWCVQNDMLQQALTIYKEWIPYYVLRDRTDLAVLTPEASQFPHKEGFNTWEEGLFHEILTSGGSFTKTIEHKNWKNTPYADIVCAEDQMERILVDYQYIRILRNMVNHANDKSKQKENVIQYINSNYPGYKNPDEMTAKDLGNALSRGLENLKPQGGKRKRK